MTAAPKRGRGRPKGTGLPPEAKKTQRIRVYATTAQEAELHEWAAHKERDLSELVLDVALRAARRETPKPTAS